MKKRISILTAIFPPAGRADGIFYTFLARELCLEGFEVHVFCPEIPAGARDADPTLSSWLPDEVTVHRLPFEKKFTDHLKFFTRLARDPYSPWIRSVEKAVRDGLISSGLLWISTPIYSNGIAGLKAAKMTGLDYVLDFRDDHFGLDAEGVKKAGLVFASTEMSARNMEALYGLEKNCISVMYCGYREKIEPLPFPEGLPWQFIYAGAMNTRTDSGVMIEAFRLIEKEYPEKAEQIRLHLFVPETRLFKTLYKRRLSGNTVFHGYRPLDEVVEKTGECVAGIATAARRLDFCVPSKVFYYLGSGRPVIGSALKGGGLEQFIRNYQIGLFAPQRNARQLAGEILKFCGDEKLRQSLVQNVRAVSSEFSVKKQVATAAGLIREKFFSGAP